jgi:hypothetical protein
MKVYLLNTTVIPCQGLWDVQPCELRYARYLAGMKDHKGDPYVISAIGHSSTAELLSTLLDAPIAANRLTVQPQEKDILLCFKLKQRPPEGRVLTVEELEELGYEFFLMELIAPSKDAYLRLVERWTEEEAHRRQTRKPDPRECMGGHRD